MAWEDAEGYLPVAEEEKDLRKRGNEKRSKTQETY